MTNDTLSPAESREVLDELSHSAPIALSLQMCRQGVPVTGEGFVDLDLTALTIQPPAGAEPLLMVFPTTLLVNRFARFFELGPRPRTSSEEVVELRRAELDDLEARARALREFPDEVVRDLNREEATRWRLELRDRTTDGERFSRAIEVFDALEGGIWPILELVPEDAEDDSIALVAGDSTGIWRGLTTILPDAGEWDAITSAG